MERMPIKHNMHAPGIYRKPVVRIDAVLRSGNGRNPLYKLESSLPLFYRHNLYLKRIADILLSICTILFILSWLTPILVILIKLGSKGPVFFIQKRNKQKGAVFNCIKFRTMYVNAEADILGAEENDKRITAVGYMLRKCHLDELPQVWNILKGDMSFVGPRPYMLLENERNERLIWSYNARHIVKPGITGLAQSMGNFGFTEDIDKLRERVQLDLYYIHHWSILMDIKILCRTLFAIIPKDKARSVPHEMPITEAPENLYEKCT